MSTRAMDGLAVLLAVAICAVTIGSTVGMLW
ncbi:MAG: hypothetical protein ACI8RZ_000801 [Myxococcota bacterium]|jgi:hypothetical protein